ncbi:putative transposase/invertase (TIGR01784 family) [Halanaerobium saccharolyticum]|uniref:Putative transposase/invertase (TIGR01784 family) n=1 Tax=Halanaerobium saccharolyticum TaxID=43595 RepID=A0A4R7YV39_9FIRM|nr:Rpn family recombination-promoting nuclease/putative transposase [Halanaerobium saccharolyticum]RAK05469.1 putative transposase/invertase (TIGR01784 family) [Halanaerobium saccharolyticum]TDV99804.1 putative transposase/invertase (TIGR01784 family) [Halanaerobium saccharolyticum]TDX52026.1 putative transposase/invertase (TIGR01784 family) [Halanaerobium saccharolyticum]
MKVIKNPHDSLFKRTLGDKEVAIDFLENYLPDNILEEIDLTEIKIAKDSFIDEELEESFSDILYNVSIEGKNGFIYLLFEHKSYFDKMTPVQMLGYITDIWELYNNQTKNKKLPPIIPILIYHGERKWNYGSRLSELIEDTTKAISDYLPDHKYLLYDFSNYSDAEIKGQIKLRLFLKLISHIFDDNFDDGLREVLPLLIELREKTTGLEYIETVVKYILNIGEEISLNELDQKAKNISAEGSAVIMTIAEKIYHDGKEEGREEGKIENMKEMIEFALELKFGLNSKDVVEDIKKINDYDKLKEIKQAIRKHDSLEDFTASLNF